LIDGLVTPQPTFAEYCSAAFGDHTNQEINHDFSLRQKIKYWYRDHTSPYAPNDSWKNWNSARAMQNLLSGTTTPTWTEVPGEISRRNCTK